MTLSQSQECIMITQSEMTPQESLKIVVNMLLVVLGLFIGGLFALIGLWLWLDYQADPAHSLLTLLSARTVALIPPALGDYLGAEARLMGLPLAGQTSAYWYMARAGGIVAYLLMWLSTMWGLTLSTKFARKLVAAPLAYGLHEFLSILAVLFALLHSAVLLGDSYINFTIFHLAIPFIAPYEPFWTGLGTTGLYLTIALAGSFYVRKQIGQKVWRTLHYLTFVAYLLALGHGLMAGTDSVLPAIKLMYAGTGCSVLFLIYYRLFTLKRA
jgi:sulfoxide reductase heme-binding subunit YedZ